MTTNNGSGDGIVIAGGKYVVRIVNYTTSDGQQIMEHVVASGTLPLGYPKFYGMANATIRVAGLPEPVNVDYQFPFPAAVVTVEEAALRFNDVANDYGRTVVTKQIQEQVRQQQAKSGPGIQIASQMPPQGIPHNRLRGI